MKPDCPSALPTSLLNCVAYGAGKALDYIGKWIPCLRKTHKVDGLVERSSLALTRQKGPKLLPRFVVYVALAAGSDGG